MSGGEATPAAGSESPAGLDLFAGDVFDRLLTRLGLPARTGADAVLRALGIWLVALVPLVVLAAYEGLFLWRDEAGQVVPRMSLFWDWAAWTQLFFFIPFATCAEVFVGGRMRAVLPHLSVIAEPADVRRLSAWAEHAARSPWLALLALPAFGFTWAWARTEIANGLDTWTSVVVPPGGSEWFSPLLDRGEWFTMAGLWVTLVSLPIFTFLWLRWVWKIGVWTAFLARVSRLRLRLMAVHPDRTGGLGSVSDVQTSFWVILLGTGVLFAGFVFFKLRIEQGNQPETLWVPVIGYFLLAPTVFLAPLFLFTSQLRATKDAARERLEPLTLEMAEGFRDRWLTDPGARVEELLHQTHTSHLADLHAAWHAVSEMRVVPLDRRSAAELFSAAALPFVVLVFLSELPEKLEALQKLFG